MNCLSVSVTPSERSAQIAADREMSKAFDLAENIRAKHFLMNSEANTVEKIKALKIPEADKKELLRLELEMIRLDKLGTQL